MIDEILEDAAERMDKSIASLEAAFARIRTGRAHPSFLDSVDVDYYGSVTPLSQMANINVEEGRTLVIACLLYTSPSPRDVEESRMPSSA